MAPANFKTYEAQARLLRAIVAAHPEVKWNYKDIKKFYGSDMTKDALNHRFRAIRNHIWTLQQAHEQGIDCKDIPVDLPKEKKGNVALLLPSRFGVSTLFIVSPYSLPWLLTFLVPSSPEYTPNTSYQVNNQVDKPDWEIAKFFGESTTDGIQFQFRGIKKDAESLKQTANSGGNPATALNLPASATSSAFSTPRKPRTPSTKTRVSGGGRSTTAKKTKQVRPVAVSEEDDEEDEEIDYNEVEDTPSKSRVRDRILDGRVSKNTHTPNPRRSVTPSRAATIAAAANIAQAAAVDLTTSDSDANTSDNAAGYDTPAPIDAKSVVMQQQTQLLLADPTPAYEQPIAHPAVQPAIQPAIQPATQPAIQPTHNGDYSSHSSFDHSQGTAPFNDDSLIFSFVETMEHGNGDFNPYMGNDGEI
ncbi:hypothetical protein ColKHC_02405 [Colletotrichum higginsianum]|nr:hypothetical protein ColKHC_02405 [Colletotrichum higginsianum]